MEEPEVSVPYKNLTFRCPYELIDRLDKAARRVNEDNPGLTYKRSAMIRFLLDQGLKEREHVG